jgi:thiol-disulfide isomerase/thioredoxin
MMRVHAPEISGTWINSEPLTLAELRGKAVLVDFWDYTCVNCLHTLPYLREWDRRYRGKGLVTIGVHAPEFAFARTTENVIRAVAEDGITYPVVLDNDYRVWEAFGNRYWPAEYLIDKDGYIRYEHAGEGGYEKTERAIQEALREIDPAVELPPPMEPVRALDAPGALARCERPTPETYLGERRGRPDVPRLAGGWLRREEYIEAQPGAEPSRLWLPYSAAEVNLVMAPGESGGGEVKILEDSLALDHQSRGADVREAADGSTYAEVVHPRMYSLVARTRYLHERVLELETRSAGLRMYAFTFVSCAA